MSQWREDASRIIARVLKETAGQEENAIRKALRDAYPWGERSNHPYKMWCSEVRRQRGIVTLTKKQKAQLAQIETHNRSLFADQEKRS